jgi:hypothetical protein
MEGHARTYRSPTVRRVIQICQSVDATARVTSVIAHDDGSVEVRVRVGDAHAVHTLRARVARALAFAHVQASESMLDGYLELHCSVPSRAAERALARAQQASTPTVVCARALALALCLVACWHWACAPVAAVHARSLQLVPEQLPAEEL